VQDETGFKTNTPPIKTEFSQEEIQARLDNLKGKTKCKICWETNTTLIKSASQGQFFYLCQECYDKGIAEGKVIPLAKFSKKELKAQKREKARMRKGLV
jgi:transposase-like protein